MPPHPPPLGPAGPPPSSGNLLTVKQAAR